MQDELIGAKTHDEGHTPCSSLRPHRARSVHHTSKCDAKNLKLGTVMGKTRACAVPQSHGSSAKSECHKLPPELDKSASVSQCGEVSMSTQGAEFVRSCGKGSHFGKRPPTLEPSNRSNLCHHLLGVGAGLEAEETRFLADARATLEQAQIIDSFFQDMEMQTWKRAAGLSLSAGMEKRYHHRLCQEGQVSADERGKIHGCTCAGLSCFWSHQRTSLACRWIYSQPTFLCTLRSESLGHQEAPDEVWLPTVLVPACTRRTGRTP